MFLQLLRTSFPANFLNLGKTEVGVFFGDSYAFLGYRIYRAPGLKIIATATAYRVAETYLPRRLGGRGASRTLQPTVRGVASTAWLKARERRTRCTLAPLSDTISREFHFGNKGDFALMAFAEPGPDLGFMIILVFYAFSIIFPIRLYVIIARLE